VFLVRSRAGGTEVLLSCSICKRPFTLATAWLMFPPDGHTTVEGTWVHQDCTKGVLNTLFGARAVLMRGTDALASMARHLSEGS
jgi:hypothetical protein